MQLGIFARTFPGDDPAQVLRAVHDAGYGVAQFNLACAGLASMPDIVPPATLSAIHAAVAESGVDLIALSGTYNMIHPDPTRRASGLRRLGVVLDAARDLDIGLVTLCTGTRDPDDQWRHHPDNVCPEAWADLCDAMAQALQMAEAAGIDLGIEPELANVVASAADARRLIETMGSARLRIVLDPANLFEQADAATARAVIADAIDRLGGQIAMAHAKDRDAAGRFVAAGRGVVDFADFTARLRDAGFDGPLVTHGLSPDEAPAVAAFLGAVL